MVTSKNTMREVFYGRARRKGGRVFSYALNSIGGSGGGGGGGPRVPPQMSVQ